MKRIVLVVLLMILIYNVNAQIEVKDGSFNKIPNFVMDDKDNHLDGNGKPMALIKITTENVSSEDRAKFFFKGNRATEFDVVPKIGELYVYLTAEEATFIEIKHPDYGKCTFEIKESLQDFGGYEMVIVCDYKPEVDVLPKHNYLIVNTDQDDAMIYINDEFVGLKEASLLLKVDTLHTWRIECDMYETEFGEIILTNGDPISFYKELKPKYGYVNVTTSPDSALVYINKKYVGITPYKSDKIKAGIHDIVVIKDNYKTISRTFEVDSSYTTNIDLNLELSVVDVMVFADSLSKIYVDNKYKGDGLWKGILNEGIHLFEARKKNYKTSFIEKELFIGANEVIKLDNPQPIFSSADITSHPSETDVYIDGNYYGKTPLFIKDIIIGQHEIRFEKQGCALSLSTITIEENEIFSIKETLLEGWNVKIQTDSIGDNVYVDGQFIGASGNNACLSVDLTRGFHTIMIERGAYKYEEDFYVKSDAENNFKLSFNKKIIIESDKDCDIVHVDGNYVGITPCETILSYGIHNVKVERDGMAAEKNIMIDRADADTIIKLSIGKVVTIKTLNNNDKIRLSINNNDKTRIFNGKTPMTMYLPFGEHYVELQKKSRVLRDTILVKEKGGLDEFILYYGQLVRFDSDKVGDIVLVDGEKIGRTPLEIDVPIGRECEVKVKRNRKFDKRHITFEKGNMAYYKFNPKKETLNEFVDNGIRYFTLNASIDNNNRISYGLSFGSYKKVGWYMSFMTNYDNFGGNIYTGLTQLLPSFDSDIDKYAINFTENQMESRLTALSGLMFKIVAPVYLKIGAGYGMHSLYNKTHSNKWTLNKEKSYEGLLLSMGMQLNMKNIIISTDLIAPNDFKTVELRVGFGIGWKKR